MIETLTVTRGGRRTWRYEWGYAMGCEGAALVLNGNGCLRTKSGRKNCIVEASERIKHICRAENRKGRDRFIFIRKERQGEE